MVIKKKKKPQQTKPKFYMRFQRKVSFLCHSKAVQAAWNAKGLHSAPCLGQGQPEVLLMRPKCLLKSFTILLGQPSPAFTTSLRYLGRGNWTHSTGLGPGTATAPSTSQLQKLTVNNQWNHGSHTTVLFIRTW